MRQMISPNHKAKNQAYSANRMEINKLNHVSDGENVADLPSLTRYEAASMNIGPVVKEH
jgi:hypothetical protein